MAYTGRPACMKQNPKNASHCNNVNMVKVEIFNHSTLLFYSESCCWQNLVSIITFFKKKEEQFYCAPIQTLKISEHQVYRDRTINSWRSYQLLGWDTWVFLDCEPKI